jgi:hypothetical protein
MIMVIAVGDSWNYRLCTCIQLIMPAPGGVTFILYFKFTLSMDMASDTGKSQEYLCAGTIVGEY